MLRKTRSTFVMALALAGGAIVGSGMIATPAYAEDYSKAFVKIYQPVADIVNAEGGDIASVTGQFPAILAVVETVDDRYAVGNLILIAGNKLSKPEYQRLGLENMLQSGKVVPEQIGQFNFFVGNLAFSAEAFPEARTALLKAIAAGYTDGDLHGLIAQSYFEEENIDGGIDYILAEAAKRTAAGAEVPEAWLLLSLQKAYDYELVEKSVNISLALLDSYPTPGNWKNALQIVEALNDLDDRQRLDLYRLMRETKSMAGRREYIGYIEAADPRVMSNEVGAVLAEGLAAGEFDSSGDDYYTEVKSIADARSSVDRREAPTMVKEATGSSDGSLALDAGDVLYSIGDYTQAETMYQAALDKNVANRNSALMMLGITQVKQGKTADAQTTLAKVTGVGASVAKFWSAYVATKAM